MSIFNGNGEDKIGPNRRINNRGNRSSVEGIGTAVALVVLLGMLFYLTQIDATENEQGVPTPRFKPEMP